MRRRKLQRGSAVSLRGFANRPTCWMRCSDSSASSGCSSVSLDEEAACLLPQGPPGGEVLTSLSPVNTSRSEERPGVHQHHWCSQRLHTLRLSTWGLVSMVMVEAEGK